MVLVGVGGWYWYTNYKPAQGMGTYAYQCDNGAQFNLAISSDMRTVELTPGMNSTFGAKTLVQSTSSAQRYEAADGSMYFVGAGEEVTLVVGNTQMSCNPVPNTEEAPFNWGDPDEGGGVRQDTSVIVAESIQGKWQSTDDAKYVREFQDGGKVVDWYDGKQVSTGTYVVYTQERPIGGITIPLQPNKVYVQLTMSGSQREVLNFTVAKLTPEELELVYMERGGVLRFSAVQ